MNTVYSWCSIFLTMTKIATRKTSRSQLLATISQSHALLSQNTVVMEHALDQEMGEQRSPQR